MNAEMVTKMVRQDSVEWERLTTILDAHQSEVLHDHASPPWVSRDVYAHLAHWIDHSNQDLEAYCAGGSVPAPIDDVEGINSQWQREDSWMTFEEARKRAQEAFGRRLLLIQSISIEQWDNDLLKIARYDGAGHFAAHRRYIVAAR